MLVFKNYYIIFIIGAVGYPLLEIIWRGYTHPSMSIAGGLCLVAIFSINLYFESYPRIIRALMCATVISATELCFGLLLNKMLHLNVWNYSNMPFNVMGQICPQYSILWFFLSYGVILILEKVKLPL